MTHPFLDPPQGRSGGGHAGSERVAQVVEPDRPKPGSAGCGLEALTDFRGVEHDPELGMRKDEVGRSVEPRSLVMLLKLFTDA
jgi:hypothetical protein